MSDLTSRLEDASLRDSPPFSNADASSGSGPLVDKTTTDETASVELCEVRKHGEKADASQFELLRVLGQGSFGKVGLIASFPSWDNLE